MRHTRRWFSFFIDMSERPRVPFRTVVRATIRWIRDDVKNLKYRLTVMRRFFKPTTSIRRALRRFMVMLLIWTAIYAPVPSLLRKLSRSRLNVLKIAVLHNRFCPQDVADDLAFDRVVDVYARRHRLSDEVRALVALASEAGL